MSLNFSMITLFSFDFFIPGQIYFALILIAQIGELISCPLYVIIYCFNQQRFHELKRILLCNTKTQLLLSESIDSSKKDIDCDVSIDISNDTDYQ